MDPVEAHLKALQLARRIGAIPPDEAAEAAREIEGDHLSPDTAAIAIRLGLPVDAFEALLTLARTLPHGAALEETDAGLLGAFRDLRANGPSLPASPQAPTVVEGEVSQATLGVPEEVQAALTRPQSRVGRYVLLSQIGVGGMGIVYRAWDPSLARVVALKTLRSEMDDTLRQRFLREGRAAARLRHPGIIAVHDVGEEDGHPYLAMDLLSGRRLSDAFEALPADALRERVTLLRDVAEAVGCAHAEGIVHRDLKPENVLLDGGGRPVVTDFGLAKEVSNEKHPLTQTGAVLGTPRYMSPEQADGAGAVGPPSDVFSLGVMLYEALTEKPPFTGQSVPEILARVIEANPLPPRRCNARIPRDMESVCLKAMEKDPSRRYPDARAFAADLSRWLAGDPVEARPVTLLRRGLRFAKRHRRASVAVLTLLAIAVTSASVWIGKRARTEARVSAAILRAHDSVDQVRQARRVANHALMQSAAASVERDLGEAMQLDPNSRDALLERGRMKALLGLFDDARADLDRAVAVAPNDPEVRAARGRLLATLYRRGVERASSAVIVDRRKAPPPEEMEAASPDLKRLRQTAEADLLSAQGGLAPKAERELTHAYLALVQQKWDEAIAAADAVLAVDLSEEACWLAGLALLGKHDPEGALARLDRAVLVGAGFGEAWLARAQAWFRRANDRADRVKRVEIRDDLAKAIEDGRRSEAEGTDPAMARMILAEVLWTWGEENHARGEPCAEQYRQGLDLLERDKGRFDDVDSLYLRSVLWDGLSCGTQKDSAQAIPSARNAIALMEEVLQRDPQHPEGLARLGFESTDLANALDNAGQDPEPALVAAAEAYTRALAKDASDPWPLLYRGDAWYELAQRGWKRGDRRESLALGATGDYEKIHRIAPTQVAQGEGGSQALLGLMDAADEKDALPRMLRAEEAEKKVVASYPDDVVTLSTDGAILLLLARAQERAGKPFADTLALAGRQFALTLAKEPRTAEALLGRAFVEIALARGERKAGKWWGERASRAFAALADWRTCDGEGLAWEGEPYLAAPFAQTLLDAEGETPVGFIDLARLLSYAVQKGPGVPGVGVLRDYAFSAIERAEKIHALDKATLRDDPQLAGLHSDPRWEKLVK